MTFRRPSLAGAPAATVAYAAVTILMTWPLARHAGSAIAADRGDPLFNCWVLLWTGGQMLHAIAGHPSALASYWQGNIFAPHPLALAYSEHLTPQSLQALPVFAISGNILLAYNTVLLATFVISGLGMYLLVRDLTGRPAAAFVAGLAFAFAPYRVDELSHLQELSCCWMPFVLYGIRRYLTTGRVAALAGASAALVLQNLSCGYYLFFFPPFVAAYALYEIARRRLLGNLRVWSELTAAAMAVGLVTWPFVSPYLALREGGAVGVRSLGEMIALSADTHSFLTASPELRLWGGRLAAYPKAEADGFSGLVIGALALTGVAHAIAGALARARATAEVPWQRVARWSLVVALAVCTAGLAGLFVTGRLILSVFGSTSMIQNAARLLWDAAAVAVLLVAISPKARAFVSGPSGRWSGAGFFVSAWFAAALLALGPVMMAGGRHLGPGPYAWLVAHIPGFDGLRVPARFLMLAALWLAVLAGFGAAALLSWAWTRRVGRVLTAVMAMVICAESWMAPMRLDVPVTSPALFSAPPVAASFNGIGPLYTRIARAPDPVRLIEFPFGDPGYDIRATYYAGFHRRPLVNGYSGYYPPDYADLQTTLGGLPDPDAAPATLKALGVTHVLVHEAAFPRERGRAISDWIASTGAALVGSDGTDRLFEMK